MTRERVAVYILTALATWTTVVTSLVLVVILRGEADPDKRAIVMMGCGLLVIWVLAGGTAMRLWRDGIVSILQRIPLGWRTRFVLLCVLMALLEEVVTTGLTNAAPLFGGVTDAARITASKNYLEVVLLHSVIVFWPSYIAWALILSRWDFSPAEVMLLYGLTGWLMELITFGPQNYGMIGTWVFVYGLMVYIPACTVPRNRPVRPVSWWMWLPAAVLPLFAGIPFVPVVLAIRWVAMALGINLTPG